MSASATPSDTAVVDLPTPPFWFAIAMIRASPGVAGTLGVAARFGARFGARFADRDPEGVEEGWEEALTAPS